MLTTITARFRDNIQFLLKHQGFRRYGANTLWLFAEKILRLTVGFFVGVWVARYLGPEKYGLLSYAQAFVFLFSAIANLGLDGIVVRELVKGIYKEEEILGSAFFLKLIGGITAFILIAAVSNFVADSSYERFLILIIALSLVFQSLNVIDMYFQSKVLSKYVVWANSFSLFLSSIIKIVLILIHASLMAFACMVTFDAFIMGLGYLYFFVKIRKSNLNLKSFKFNKNISVNLLRDSWPLIFSAVAISIYMRIDQVMIKEMLGNKEVGFYTVAVRLTEVWYFIPMVITQSVFPAIVKAKNVDNKLYNLRLKNLYSLMIYISFAISVIFYLGSDWIVENLYGATYSKASQILKIYIWATIFVFLGVASSKYLLSENYTKISFLRTLVGGIVNLILNFILIPIFGAKGAAMTTLVSFAIAVFFILFIPKTRNQGFSMLKSVITRPKVRLS